MLHTKYIMYLIFFLKHKVYLFNSKISNSVRAHSETSNITKNIALFATTMHFFSQCFSIFNHAIIKKIMLEY